MRLFVLSCSLLTAFGAFAAPTPYSVDVRDFGAVGDGVHDDTLALQKAADAARVNSLERGQMDTMVKRRLSCTQDGPVPEVYFPKGIYRTTGPVVFTGNAFLRGEEAEIRNETSDRDTFFFDLGFRVDIEGLRFTGGRHQVRQFTQNRDIASARIADCAFERAHGTALLLDCFSDVKVQRSAGKAAFFKSAYEMSRTPEGLVTLTDVDPASRKPAANSTLVLVERCRFRDCARAVFAHSDGVNIDRCSFFDSGVAKGPIVQVRTTTQLSRLTFDCRGKIPGRFAIAFGRGSNTAMDIDIRAPEGMDPFLFDIPPTYSNGYDNYGSSLVLRNVTLDTGRNPVLTVGADYLPEMISLHDVRRARADGVKPKLFAFRRVPTDADLCFWTSKHRQACQGVKGVFGWAAAGVDDFDTGLPAHLARLRCPAGRNVERDYLEDAPVASSEGVFTDPSVGVADRRTKQDDTDRVEALLRRAAAAGGGTVLLPPRWITLSRTLDVPRHVRLTSSGKAVLRATDYRLVFFRTAADDPDVVFSNLLFNRGASVLETAAAKGRVRFDNCHFYDQDGVTLKAQAAGPSRLRLEVRGGTSFVPHLYDGNAAPAVFDSFWFEYAPDFDKTAWDVVSAKSQTAIVNRPGGVLRCINVLGVPCVYWHAAKSKDGLKGGFFAWVAHPEDHPELYGDFRWVDNYGDYLSLDFRYGGEWAGLTPVYQHGADAKSLISGHIVGGSLYGWTKAKQATVLSDVSEANVVLTDLFCMNRQDEPTTVLWRNAAGRLARAKGWIKENCYPHAQRPSDEEKPPADGLWISNHTDFPGRRILLDLVGKTNFTYDAKGAPLTVRDPAIALRLKDCLNVTIRNLTIDWERPVLTEGRIVGFAGGETRVAIDRDRTPFAVEDGRLLVTGPGRREPIRAVRFLDGRTFEPVLLTADASFRETRVRQEPDGTVSILADYSRQGVGLKVGDVLVFRPFERPYPAVFVEGSSDVVFEDLVVHDAYGMGVIAQMSENVAWRGTGAAASKRSGVIPRKGSHVTTHADASHFSNCGGQVTVENCWFEGMMDDAINVHSTCVQITNVLSRSSVRCVFRHDEAIGFELFRPGDRVRLIRSRTNEDGPVLPVSAVRRIADDTLELDFAAALPADFGVGDTVENADFQCAATFRNNVVKNNRARGVLFTTPGKVICSSNRFERCCGSAVVLASDAAYWFESGHCHDVEIAGNVISNCLSAGYGRHGSAFGIISVDPIVRDLKAQKAFCHDNIRIVGNEIFTPDVTWLFARSATGLVWSNNVVHVNGDLPSWNRPKFVLERCGTFATDVPEAKR